MEKVTGCFMSVLLLSAVLSSGLAEEKIIRAGGTLELRPKSSGEINTVTWKLNSDMVAEWLKSINDLSYYDKFKGRTTLDKVTGTLEMTNMSSADSGEYSVEINNMVLPERYNVKVFKEVPQPVLEFKPLACAATSDSCTLHCEGNTTGAEPVTYSWKMGEVDWVDGANSRTIKPNETKSIKTFSCRIKNRISEKQSDTKENIFYGNEEVMVGGGPDAGAIVGSVFGLLAAAGLVGVGIWKREYVKEKIQPLIGHGKTVTINDAETGTLLDNKTSNGPAGGPGAAPTQGADGEPGAAHTQGADGEPGAAHTQGADGEPGEARTQGADGPDAASTQGAGGPDAASTQGADGEPGAASTQGAGGPDAASTQGADGEPGAASTQGADGPDAASTQGADGEPGAARTQGADGEPSEAHTQGADGEPSEAHTQGADGEPSEAHTQGADGEPGAAHTQGADGEPGEAHTQGADGEPGAAFKTESDTT